MKRLALALALALWIPSCNALAQQMSNTAAKITASSGNVAAATATASIAAVAGTMNYICGLSISGGGATGASVISPTLTGLNGGTMTFSIGVVAGATLGTPPFNMNFEVCQPATALNTAITLSVPSFGTGNTNATAVVWGFRLPN